MDVKVLFFVVVALLAGCADSDQPGPDGHPQAAGAENVRQAVRAYTKSEPVRRVSQYAEAVGQGLTDPLVENAKRQGMAARATSRGMNAPRPLADDERCIGSSIVRVDRSSKVPSYTQVLQGGRPIYCTGAVY